MEPTSPGVETPPDQRSSLVARLMNVFAAPGEVFDEVKATPPATANWLVPTILLALVGVASTLLVSSLDSVKRQKLAMQEAVLQKMVSAGKMPQEAADKAMAKADAGGGTRMIFEAVAAPVGAFISLFWSALLLWLGSIVLRNRFGYSRALEIAGLAGMIALLGVIVKTLLILATGNMFAAASPGLLLKNFDPLGNPWHGILSVLDLFGLWALGVKSCGLARLAGVSFTKGATWVFGVWLALTALMFVVGLAAKRLMGF